MILEQGDMWSVFGKTGIFLVTTNPIVTKLGKCVMGRGIAKQMADKYPEVPFTLGHILRNKHEGCGTIGRVDGQWIGYFMVKDHWMEPAKLEIIEGSTTRLQQLAEDGLRIDLNFPGIGNGKLKREDVLPLLQVLPDNVHVWEYASI